MRRIDRKERFLDQSITIIDAEITDLHGSIALLDASTAGV